MSFHELIKECVEFCICEARKEDNMLIIEDEILSPIIDFILEKLRPYILYTSVFIVTVVLLLLTLLVIIITK